MTLSALHTWNITVDYMYLLTLFINFSYRNIKRVAPANGKAKISLLGDYDPKGVKIIDDPYYVSEEYEIYCLH